MAAARQRHELHRIVIVGGGTGGLVTATHLTPTAKTFAQAGYKYWPGDFGGLDRATQTIKLKPTPLPAAGEMLPEMQIHYDTLILALGSQVNDFGTPGVLEHCHFIDDIGQATAFNDLLRSRVVLAAKAGEDLNVVIVGGGATGVELAANGVEINRRGQVLMDDINGSSRSEIARASLARMASRCPQRLKWRGSRRYSWRRVSQGISKAVCHWGTLSIATWVA
jgi:NADH dehydrogenase FAD-containing subunit